MDGTADGFSVGELVGDLVGTLDFPLVRRRDPPP